MLCKKANDLTIQFQISHIFENLKNRVKATDVLPFQGLLMWYYHFRVTGVVLPFQGYWGGITISGLLVVLPFQGYWCGITP